MAVKQHAQQQEPQPSVQKLMQKDVKSSTLGNISTSESSDVSVRVPLLLFSVFLLFPFQLVKIEKLDFICIYIYFFLTSVLIEAATI